jgi:S-formylglutathione hydrolase FrmB
MAIISPESPITAGNKQLVIRPNRLPDRLRYPILYTHGAGSGPDANMAYGNARRRTQLVADAGITGVCSDFGGPFTWGNSLAMETMTDAYNWLQSQPGVKPGKVLIAGGSMGGLNALAWTAANPDKVAAVSTYIPVLNPSQIHDRNLGGYAASIDSAYGDSWDTATLRATRDPLYMAGQGKYAGIPIRIHYGLQDTLCLPENPPAFKQAVGGDLVTINGVQGGHAEVTELQIDRHQERDWLLSYST